MTSITHLCNRSSAKSSTYTEMAVAGFQVSSSQQNYIRVIQVEKMVKEIKHRSSSKQANVTLPILNSSAALTTSSTCYENPCLIIDLKILIVFVSAL